MNNKKFSITTEQRHQIVLSTTSVPLEKILLRVRKQQNSADRHLTQREVFNWLDANGFVEKKRDYNGKTFYGATAEGRKIGIGDYRVKPQDANNEEIIDEPAPKCFFNINAQALIVSNLEEIADLSDEIASMKDTIQMSM